MCPESERYKHTNLAWFLGDTQYAIHSFPSRFYDYARRFVETDGIGGLVRKKERITRLDEPRNINPTALGTCDPASRQERREQADAHALPRADSIQASLQVEREEARKLKLDPDELPPGAIVGSVEIVDCVRNAKSKWAIRGQWHWILRNPRVLTKPIPFKGKLGFIRVSNRLLKGVRFRAP